MSKVESLEKREKELRESIGKLQEISASTEAYDKELAEEFNQRSLCKNALDNEIQILEKQMVDLQEWLDTYFKTTKESLEAIMKKFRGNIFGINSFLRNIISNLQVPISVP